MPRERSREIIFRPEYRSDKCQWLNYFASLYGKCVGQITEAISVWLFSQGPASDKTMKLEPR